MLRTCSSDEIELVFSDLTLKARQLVIAIVRSCNVTRLSFRGCKRIEPVDALAILRGLLDRVHQIPLTLEIKGSDISDHDTLRLKNLARRAGVTIEA
jgi:hypothetical protein